MKLTRQSLVSGVVRTRELPVTEDQMKAWTNGALIQNAFPNLTESDREWIKSGITDDEWTGRFRGDL